MAETEFAEEKAAAIGRLLGKPTGTIAPTLGDSPAVHVFDRPPAGRAAVATTDLIGEREARLVAAGFGPVELVAYTAAAPSEIAAAPRAGRFDEWAFRTFAGILAAARYDPVTSGCLIELPELTDEGAPEFLALVEFPNARARFTAAGKDCAMLTVIRLHRREYAYAETRGLAALIKEMKAANLFPLSDVDRAPFV
jgi:hypothetical protein